MAITGSGSLAISLSVFVISAAFLPKGESSLLFARLARACGCVCRIAKSGRGDDVGGEKLWCVCAPRCAPASPGIAASLSPRRCGLHEVLLPFSTLVFGVLS